MCLYIYISNPDIIKIHRFGLIRRAMSDLSEKALKNAEKNEAKRQAKMAKFLAKQAKIEVIPDFSIYYFLMIFKINDIC